MRPTLALGLLGALGCSPSEGAVFIGRTGSTSAAASTSEADATTGSAAEESVSTADASCEDIGVVEGNDPRFEHACGEDCDTDWCACAPCAMIFGPLGRVPAGSYALRVQGGASGSGTFAFALRDDDGVVFAEATRTYDGLFDDTLDVELDEDCSGVDLTVELQSAVCSRIYEVELVRR